MIANSVKAAAIKIPKCIKRSPTDLLKALSGTIGTDANTPNYKYLDDPFTIPLNTSEKRNFSLAKVSGIKAARMMINKYPLAFYKDECEPHVPAFFPEKTFTEEELANPSESLIYSFIDWGKFLDAVNIYQKCKDEKINVSEECKRALFEVLCIYNSNNLNVKTSTDEEFYNRASPGSHAKVMQSTWKTNSEAEIMFAELTNKDASAYCSLIKGMLIRNEIVKAFELYQTMTKENMIPDVETYNLLIRNENLRQEHSITRESYEHVLNYLTIMSKNGVTPNLRTFNNFLYALNKSGKIKKLLLCL